MTAGEMPRLGHLRPPFPVPECANVDCPDPVLTEQTEAVLFRDLLDGKLVVFCGVCSLSVELNRPDRWVLVAL